MAPTKSTTTRQRILGDLFNVWGLSLLIAVVSAPGLGPALRGAGQGMDSLITTVDRIGATTSQFAAIATWILVVHLAMLCIKVAQPRLVSLGIVLTSTLPVVTLMSAQRVRLGLSPTLFALGATALVVSLSAVHMERPKKGLRVIMICAGVSLAAEALRILLAKMSGTDTLRMVLAHLRWFFSSAVILVVVWRKFKASRSGIGILPTILFLALLAVVTIEASRQPEAPLGVVVIGRSLASLLPTSPAGLLLFAQAYPLGLALLTLAWTLLSRLRGEQHEHAGLLISAVLALSVTLPPSPLVVASAALSALAAVFLSAQDAIVETETA